MPEMNNELVLNKAVKLWREAQDTGIEDREGRLQDQKLETILQYRCLAWAITEIYPISYATGSGPFNG